MGTELGLVVGLLEGDNDGASVAGVGIFVGCEDGSVDGLRDG